MDPLSQAVVGALGGAAGALILRKPQHLRKAALAGMMGGLIPDLDVLIHSSKDPLIGILMHRHFTHALLMAPLVGLAAALLSGFALRACRMSELSWRWIWLYSTLGVATHGPLDALTNYGTHLFWPILQRRESWNAISIIDPIFTVTLIGLMLFAVLRKSERFIISALIFAGLYISFGFVQNHRAQLALHELAESRGHVPARAFVNPTFGNLLAWRLVYEAEGQMYSDGIHLGWNKRIYQGSSAVLYRLPSELLPPDSFQAQQFEHFRFFANDWLVSDNTDLLVKDARFAALPTDIGGFWGVRLKPDVPATTLDWVNFSGRDTSQWPQLRAMILGKAL